MFKKLVRDRGYRNWVQLLRNTIKRPLFLVWQRGVVRNSYEAINAENSKIFKKPPEQKINLASFQKL